MDSFVFNTVARIVSSTGSALRLAEQCAALDVKRPLLVTDPGLVKIGLVEPVRRALVDAGVDVVMFDQVREDPPEEIVLQAAQLGRTEQVDGVLAVGGGSSMDVAKVGDLAVVTRPNSSLRPTNSLSLSTIG